MKPGTFNPAVLSVQKIISDMLEPRIHGVPADVDIYYEEPHVADITMMINGNKVKRKAVPIERGAALKDSYSPQGGERVWVQFRGGNIHDPVIIGKYNPAFDAKRHQNTEGSAQYSYMSQYL
jgi:hypothetical protein